MGPAARHMLFDFYLLETRCSTDCLHVIQRLLASHCRPADFCWKRCAMHQSLCCDPASCSMFTVSYAAAGIVPYINASIVLQLLATSFPSLKRLQRDEGTQGRETFKQYQKFAGEPAPAGVALPDWHHCVHAVSLSQLGMLCLVRQSSSCCTGLHVQSSVSGQAASDVQWPPSMAGTPCF